MHNAKMNLFPLVVLTIDNVLHVIYYCTFPTIAPKNNDVRLVGSKTDGQGAVEMFVTSYGWIRLCPGAFDLSGVCSKLGYTSTAYQTFS